jgi:hypothetical protein
MVGPWHDYLARCQFMLRRGLPVADILYLAPEGAPHVFRPPASAMRGSQPVPDRREYNFDGCAPETLLAHVSVQDGNLVLPHGMSYRVLVLPEVETITPALLRKVKQLVEAGATVLGPRPLKSPSLSGYPKCDDDVRKLAAELWGTESTAESFAERALGKGRLVGTPSRPRTASAAPEPTQALAKAKWIWHREGHPASAAPVGKRQFRCTVPVDGGRPIESARLFLTADNGFTVQLNGEWVGEGDNFTVAYAFDVKPRLRAGTNLLAVIAENGGDKPNPAGLIGALEVRFRDGPTLRVTTDRQWESAVEDSASWQPALELGEWGMKPWGKIGDADVAAQYPPLYGEYDQVTGVLARMGVPPDFESDAPLRYTHRRDGDTDIYFVANRDATALAASCAFRVTGRVPTAWDPATGVVSALCVTEEKDGRTRLTLPLEPHGSRFVVFRRERPATLVARDALSANLEALMEVRGPWEVRFQPRRGAPERVSFETLGDWAQHSDPGVKHFSGVATYVARFQATPFKSPSYLDLGNVRVMASVRLNGQDLGVLWKAPFRVEVTRALRAGENQLEIAVANLWPNRLIGDASLPKEQRVAWTTWNPYKPGAPLLESGLLGPVKILQPAPPSSPSP